MNEEKNTPVWLELMRNPFVVNSSLRKNKRWCGIYSLSLGDKFYIGRSKNINARAKQHRSEIMRLMKLEEVPPTHYLFKAMQHLNSNKGIRNLDISILEECKEVELLEKEQYWLTNYKDNSNCLNLGFVALKSSYEVSIENFQPINLELKLVIESPKQKRVFENFIFEFNLLQEGERIKKKSISQ